MQQLKTLIQSLKQQRLTIAAAESCSGGYLGYLLTKTPGSSKVFKGGLVIYSLEAKHKLLGLPTSLLNKTQGVSKQVAQKLAKKVRRVFASDIGVAIVGFAGPEAARGYRAGTVFVAVADKEQGLIKKAVIKGSRDQVRKQASQLALEMIYANIHRRRPASRDQG